MRGLNGHRPDLQALNPALYCVTGPSDLGEAVAELNGRVVVIRVQIRTASQLRVNPNVDGRQASVARYLWNSRNPIPSRDIDEVIGVGLHPLRMHPIGRQPEIID